MGARYSALLGGWALRTAAGRASREVSVRPAPGSFSGTRHGGGGATADNSTWGQSRIELPHDVAPGEEVVFPVTAPTAPGTYHFQWRMVQDGVRWFGDFTSDIPVVVAPVLRSMPTGVSPATLRIRTPVSVTITATDRVTGAPVQGNVIVGGVAKATPGRRSHSRSRPTAQLVDGEWEWVPVVPAASVEAPGYNPGAVAFEVIS